MMKWTRYLLLMPVLMVQALSSCSLIDEPEYDEGDGNVTASVAFTISSSTGAATRMIDAVVQEQENGRSYRGLGDVYMIPFAISGTQVTSSDHPSRLLQDASLLSAAEKTGNYGGFYLYNIYTLVRGINAFLVYARPPEYSTYKAINGKLVFPDLVYPDIEALRFSPCPIYSDGSTGTPAAPPKAVKLASYLTWIAQASGNGISWSNNTDATLKGIFMNFTGQENDGNMLLAGSSVNVMNHVQALYDQMSAMRYDEGSAEEALVADILDHIKNYSAEFGSGTFTVSAKLTALGADGYPESEGLPDGAAVLRWDGDSFEPQTTTNPMAPINRIDRFCYPPELFYYANSRIYTSNEPVETSDYSSATDWDALLDSKYKNQQNAMVTGNTQAVAIKEPLQYAVGRLKMSMQAETTTGKLKDAADKDVTLTGTSFPLTGVIICNQHPVGFDFKPVLDAGAASHAEDCFIYDTQIGTNYLTTTPTPIPSTLVLQSYDTGEGVNKTDAEEVIIALEFRNDSGQKFKGKDGVIYEGTKFYLMGKITPLEINNPEDYQTRVFTQDYVTTVSTKVETLANAYNVLPDLLGGRLEIGVELTTNWIQAETTNVILQ